MLPLPLLLFPSVCLTLAAPQPDVGSIHIPIVRRVSTVQDRIANLPRMVDIVRAKYGYSSSGRRKRSVTSAALTDEQNDSRYSAVVRIGTPAQNFNLILDLASTDLWVATTQCGTCGSGIPLFNSSKSSSYVPDLSVINITYSSVYVAGNISQDTVVFAGFSMSQTFLSVSQSSSGVLADGLSGIMGLAWESASVFQTTPFWQVLYNQSKLSSPMFSLYLERHIDDSQAINKAPGGMFTLGGTNTSLYSGNIEFIDMPGANSSTPSYWVQQVRSITIRNDTISISSSEGLAIIDISTTFIGGPSDLVARIWSNVPNSEALSGEYQGFYAFPCNTTVNVSISFGGTHWVISPVDMNIGTISGSGSEAMCAGGIYDLGTSAGDSYTWIVGDTFLKNVYSVFQANPPAVGFAQLASSLSNFANSSSGTPFSPDSGVPLPSSPSSNSPSVAGTSGAASVASLTMLLMLVVTVFSGWYTTL